MEYTVTAEPGHINLSATGLEEIMQNVRMILSTLQDEVPLDRAFARTGEAVDRPEPAAINSEISAIYRAIRQYEPRVEVTDIRFEAAHAAGMDGSLVPRIKIKVKEGVL